MGQSASGAAARALRRFSPAMALLLTAGVSGVLVAQSVSLFQLDLSVFRDAGAAFTRGLPSTPTISLVRQDSGSSIRRSQLCCSCR